MSRQRGGMSDSDSEFEDYKYKYYKELRDGKVKVRISSSIYRCPYCRDNEYSCKELLRHANRVGRESKSAGFRDKAKHLGLVRYLKGYLDSNTKSSRERRQSAERVRSNLDRKKGKSSPPRAGPFYDESIESEQSARSLEPGEIYEEGEITEPLGKYAAGKSSWSTLSTIKAEAECVDGKKLPPGNARSTEPMCTSAAAKSSRFISATIKAETECRDGRTFALTSNTESEMNSYSGGTHLKCSLKSIAAPAPFDSNGKTVGSYGGKATEQSYTGQGGEELIVWPWMAVVANIPTEFKGGRYSGESGKKLREEWVAQGYNPVKVHPLWSVRGHSGFAIVNFERDWTGFTNALTFEKAFERDKQGKRDWSLARHKGDKLYAWIARADDYNSRGLIGDHLRKNGDLKTIAAIEKEDKMKDTKLVDTLTNALDSKNEMCEEFKRKISRTEIFISDVVRQKEEMVEAYNEEMKMMEQKAKDVLTKVFLAHEQSKRQLEAHEKLLKAREALNENEKRNLQNQKKMNEMAILEQQKADESMMILAEDQKRKKEELHRRVLELEKKLDDKQMLELEINQMKGAIEVMKHMGESGDTSAKKKMEAIKEELKDKEEELESMEDMNQTLIVQERKLNDELQDARKELIKGLKDSKGFIGVKRMGELEAKPFLTAARKKYPKEEALEKATELCSLWEDHLRDPSWHPFKVITVGEVAKEIIDEEDEKIKSLKHDLGDQVYEAVIKALREMNEYNPSGRYPLPELWNKKENRKAHLAEVAEYIIKQWKFYKKKK